MAITMGNMALFVNGNFVGEVAEARMEMNTQGYERVFDMRMERSPFSSSGYRLEQIRSGYRGTMRAQQYFDIDSVSIKEEFYRMRTMYEEKIRELQQELMETRGSAMSPAWMPSVSLEVKQVTYELLGGVRKFRLEE